MPLPDTWPTLAVLIPGAIGYGELRARVGGLRKDVDLKADGEVVKQQYSEILRRLDRIEDRVNHTHTGAD